MIRFECCEHCIARAENCPRISGHELPCTIKNCEPEIIETGPISEEESRVMGRRDERRIREAKEDLIDHVRSVLGREPEGLRSLLRAISHPDVINEAIDYLSLVNPKTSCERYPAPWNCFREAEAKYETMKHGWTGAAGGVIGYSEGWCIVCRSKALGA